jgi:hypothetical protein
MIANIHARLDASSLARALADRTEEVGTALLGEPSVFSRREHRWGRHGSLSLCRLGPKRGSFYDHERGEGGDLLTLIARERCVALGEAIRIAQREFLGGIAITGARKGRQRPLREGNGESRRMAIALRTWSEAVPIAGTLAERYFAEHRKLDVEHLSEVCHALRWHAGIRAVVGLMTDPISGRSTGVHRTFLDNDGAKIERKMLGRQGVVRLSLDDAVTTSIGITEGLEDAMAILLSGWSPVWAATSAGAIARFPVLAGIEALTIFADTDLPGIQAAEICSARWAAAGREVRITSPGVR